PLQNNGGPTQTHALLPSSPAIGGGDPSGCYAMGSLLTTDQRGFPRPAAGCDIGAFEVFLSDSTSVVAALLPTSRSVQVGTPATAVAPPINVGQASAAGCSIPPLSNFAGTFVYQTPQPGPNKVPGFPNTAANIHPGAAQSFIFAITPTEPAAPTDIQFAF